MPADIKNTLGLNAARAVENEITNAGTSSGVVINQTAILGSQKAALEIVNTAVQPSTRSLLRIFSNEADTASTNGLVYIYNQNATSSAKVFRIYNAGSGEVLKIENAGTGNALEISSTTSAVQFPAMTSAQKNAIGNSAGRVVFDTTLGKLCVNTGAAWQTISSA